MRIAHSVHKNPICSAGCFLLLTAMAAGGCSDGRASNLGTGGAGVVMGGAGGLLLGGATGGGQGGAFLTTTGGAISWGTTGAGGTGTVGGSGCPIEPAACNDGKDNDGDGKSDAMDSECVGPCDNDEGSFATGIAGDNVDACKQDCFFDGNSGQGDDGCDWNLKCDPQNPGGKLAKACPYDDKYKNCPTAQSSQCIQFCQRLTPNGCDCFGCCAVPYQGTTITLMMAATCSEAAFGDPVKCPRCTQSTSCTNPCGKCEICIGKPAPDPSCNIPPIGQSPDAGLGDSGVIPPEDSPCPPGIVYCGNGGSCPSGRYCQTGCCNLWIP